MRDMRENVLPVLDCSAWTSCSRGTATRTSSALLRRHYTHVGTLASAMFADSGDGRPNGDGAYEKSAARPAVRGRRTP